MKKIYIFIFLFIYSSLSLPCQYWEHMPSLIGGFTNSVTDSEGNTYFISQLNDSISYEKPKYHLWKITRDSDKPIDCYSTTDTIFKIYISNKNDILLFKGNFLNSIAWDKDRIIEYYRCYAIISSNDYGRTWNQVEVSINGKLSIIESSDNSLLVTGSKIDLSDRIIGNNTIYKSTDSGNKWFVLGWNKGEITILTKLKNGNILLVADSLLYSSTDYGETWNFSGNADLRIDYSRIIENNKGILFNYYFEKSLDTGRTWIKNNALINNDRIVTFTLLDNDDIYAIGKNGNFYRSTDDGSSWKFLSSFNNLLYAYDKYYYKPQLIGISNEIYILTITDSTEQTWNYDVKLFHYDKKFNMLIDYFGVLFSRGDDWSIADCYSIIGNNITINNYNKLQFIDLKLKKIIWAIDEIPLDSRVADIQLAPNNTIYCILEWEIEKYRKYVSTNDGLTWRIITDTLLLSKLSFGKKNEMYSIYKNQVYVSYNDGKSFGKYGNPVPDVNYLGFYRCSGISPWGYFYINIGNRIYWTSDNGIRWEFSSNSLWYVGDRIRFDKNETVYYNGYDSDLYWVSTDKGVTWKWIFRAIDYGYDYDIHPNGDFYLNMGRIYHTSNKGSTWDTIENKDFYYDDRININTEGIIFISGYHSNDKGKSWIKNAKGGIIGYNDKQTILQQEWQTGWNTESELNLFIFIKPTDISDISKRENKFSISPNPAKDFIEISVGANCGSHGEIVIYDLFGQKVTTPALRATPPYEGGEKLRIDVSSLAPGMYFVKIGAEVHKFVKL